MSTKQGLKERLALNGYILNGYCQMPGPLAAEIYSRQGWDAVTLDLEHGSIGFDSAVAMLQAITASGVVPMVRVPAVDPVMIGMMLDAGVLGITCAAINTAADAVKLVRSCKYPPRGDRGLGRLTRAAVVHGPDYHSRANELTTVFAMIETAEGMKNLDVIAAVDGLDGVYMGPVDLAMSVLGKMPQIGVSDPAVDAVINDAIDRVLQRCASRQLIAGINASTPEEAWRMIQRGFRFITLSSDVRALTLQSKAWVDGLRRLAGNVGAKNR